MTKDVKEAKTLNTLPVFTSKVCSRASQAPVRSGRVWRTEVLPAGKKDQHKDHLSKLEICELMDLDGMHILRWTRGLYHIWRVAVTSGCPWKKVNV